LSPRFGHSRNPPGLYPGWNHRDTGFIGARRPVQPAGGIVGILNRYVKITGKTHNAVYHIDDASIVPEKCTAGVKSVQKIFRGDYRLFCRNEKSKPDRKPPPGQGTVR